MAMIHNAVADTDSFAGHVKLLALLGPGGLAAEFADDSSQQAEVFAAQDVGN